MKEYFINIGENQVQRFNFKFRVEISARDVSDFKVYLSYFRVIGSTKLPQPWYVKSMDHSEDNFLHYYRQGTTKSLVGAVETCDVTANDAETSRRRRHPHFVFSRFLAY